MSEANEGAAAQREGTREQMSAQAHLVATMDTRFERDFERGVAASDAGAKRVAALHDAKVTEISNSANDADHQHDATITKELFPAVEHGDRAASLAALAKADKAVGIASASSRRSARTSRRGTRRRSPPRTRPRRPPASSGSSPASSPC